MVEVRVGRMSGLKGLESMGNWNLIFVCLVVLDELADVYREIMGDRWRAAHQRGVVDLSRDKFLHISHRPIRGSCILTEWSGG